MALFDDLRALVQRLAPRGWAALLARHGLKLDAPDLAAELLRPLRTAAGKTTIKRALPGFADFSRQGRAGIEPGDPARSLLFHALASPLVRPDTAAAPQDADFPTLEELDIVENYVYALARRRLADLGDVVVAVFAHQYRPGSSSVHGRHADMAYARTGIARVGTRVAHYDAQRRSFWAEPAGGGAGLAVMPARYAAFLALRRKPGAKDAVVHPLQGPLDGDAGRVFLMPVHKLFAGTECLVGETVQLAFHEAHRSEKLRRLHQLPAAQGGVPPLPGFDIDQPPFVRDSAALVNLQSAGAGTLLVPQPRPALVETQTQHNSVSGQAETLRFQVPPATQRNRFITSFQVPASNAGRAAPEYAHIRLHVRPDGQVFDVNTLDDAAYDRVLSSARFQQVPGVPDGPLLAAHLLDGSCEGAVSVQLTLSRTLRAHAAMSLVAAPDLLPLVGQIDVQRWVERKGLFAGNYFAQGGPEPLCYGRDVPPNPSLRDPQAPAAPAFDRGDAANATIVALVGPAARGTAAVSPLRDHAATSWLTDGAANVFEPGWDTAMFGDANGAFYANFGLGSPFPEDAKLCAALNSFWPAAAPDAGRTFAGKTALPLLDDEIGLHPQHPRVLAGQAATHAGWDGEFGPFFAAADTVNFASIARSDYSIAALQGRLGLGLLGRISTEEQLARMDAFRECVERIVPAGTPVSEFDALLVTAEAVDDWAQRADRFDASLSGPGYLYVFADLGASQPDPADRRRRRALVANRYTCQVSPQRVGLRRNAQAPQVTPRHHP